MYSNAKYPDRACPPPPKKKERKEKNWSAATISLE